MNTRPDPVGFEHLNNAAVAAEQALIGTCAMGSPSFASAMGLVEAEHFGVVLHRQIWATMLELANDGRQATVLPVLAKLGNPLVTDTENLAQYLARCCADTTCPPVYVPDFARQVREFWALRVLNADGTDMRAAALLPGANPRTLIADQMQRLDYTRSALEPRRARPRPLRDVAENLIDRMQRQMVGEILQRPISTGLRDLDRRLGGGFKPGELVVIAGRPGMGKTTLGASLARQSARAGHAGVFFSLEMPADQIGARFIADEAFSTATSIEASQIITANEVLQGTIDDARAQRAIDAARSFRSLPLEIDDSSSMTVGELGARARTIADRFARAGHKLEFITIDYLKFLRASDRYWGQRVLEVGEITAGLKSLAKDMDIAVVLLAQLNREVEKTADKRPQLSQLRESGEIEQDADVVMLLFREAYYLANDPALERDAAKALRFDEMEHKLEIIVAKQRMGETRSVEAFCHLGASAVRDSRS